MKPLLLDQGLPRSTAALLSQGEWDVIHVSEIGMSRADDTEVLHRARADSRVCVTLDADFHSLLAKRARPICDTDPKPAVLWNGKLCRKNRKTRANRPRLRQWPQRAISSDDAFPCAHIGGAEN